MNSFMRSMPERQAVAAAQEAAQEKEMTDRVPVGTGKRKEGRMDSFMRSMPDTPEGWVGFCLGMAILFAIFAAATTMSIRTLTSPHDPPKHVHEGVPSHHHPHRHNWAGNVCLPHKAHCEVNE